MAISRRALVTWKVILRNSLRKNSESKIYFSENEKAIEICKLTRKHQYTSYKIPEENGGDNKETIKKKIITENFLALES